MSRVPSFDFSNATASNGAAQEGIAQYDPFDKYAPTTLHGAGGFLLVLNGVNINRRMTDVLGPDGTASDAIYPLQIIAPRFAVAPLLSSLGQGRVFGTGFHWRIRCRNSRTGEVSGLSPLADTAINLGSEITQGSTYYVGQTAYIRVDEVYLPGGDWDYLDLFRNTSAQQDVFYLQGTAARVVGGQITFTDDTPDEELLLNETHLLNPAPSWQDGIMPPVCGAYQHPTNRTLYFGLRRMSAFETSGITVTIGVGATSFAVGSSSTDYRPVEQARIGQRFVPLQYISQDINDPTNYRIIDISPDGLTVYIWPPIQKTALISTSGSYAVTWRIDDDRDGRALYFSEPNKPLVVDPLQTLYVGEDYSDEIQAVFGVGGVTYVHTLKGLFALQNDFTENPFLSTYVTKVSSEGITGQRAGCLTPWGWVYLHRDLGVRIFSGGQSQPLGAQDGLMVFAPQTQFGSFMADGMNMAVMAFDGYTGKVYLSYIGTGRSCLDQVLTYDFQTGVWRGPHPMRLQSVGRVLGSGGEDLQVFGDDLGNIYTPEASTGYDLVVNDVDNTMSGTVAGVTSDSFDCNSATFDGSGDKRLRGAPIWFESQAGIRYYSFIAEVDGDDVYLVHPPVTLDGSQGTLAAGWTFKVGGIGWRATTAYIDAGEPIQPKKALIGRARFERVTAAGGDFTFKVDPDDTGTFAGESTSVTTINKIYAEPRFMVQGAAHKFRLEGLTQTAKPRITVAAVDMEVKGGKGTK